MRKLRRVLFGVNRRQVTEMLDTMEAEHAKELSEKLAEIDELNKKNMVAEEQIQRYKSNESFMTETLIDVMERAENAELQVKALNKSREDVKLCLEELNKEYVAQLAQIQENVDKRIQSILAGLSTGNELLEGDKKEALPAATVAEEEHSEEEYQFKQNLLEEETPPTSEGFDLKEAVTPKQRLDEICKELGLM